MHLLYETSLYKKLLDHYYFNWSHPEELNKIFEALEQHTKLHFEHEKQMMKEITYAKSSIHLQEHEKLNKALHQINLQWQQHPQNTNFLGVCSFIRQWIIDHIAEFDTDLSEAWKIYQQHNNLIDE
jgi:hemerythrin-like metal-binding protein